jgi:hypothetical protein
MTTDTAPKWEIPREPVVSSNIASIGYDAPTETLAVQFQRGHIYHYAGVSVEFLDRFKTADSMGRFYSEHIRGKFDSELMTGVCPACHDIGWVNRTCEDCGVKKYAEIDRIRREER